MWICFISSAVNGPSTQRRALKLAGTGAETRSTTNHMNLPPRTHKHAVWLADAKSVRLRGPWTHRIMIPLKLHYPEPPAVHRVVGNPLSVDYCNPSVGRHLGSEHPEPHSGLSAAPLPRNKSPSRDMIWRTARCSWTHHLVPGAVSWSSESAWGSWFCTTKHCGENSFNLLVKYLSPPFSLPCPR